MKLTWKSLETSLKLLWNIHETFLTQLKLPFGLPWDIIKVPLKVLHFSFKHPTPLEHPWKLLETSLKYLWNFPEIPFEGLSNTLETHWNLPWNTLQFSLKHPRNYLEIPLKLSWNTLKSFLKLLGNFLETPNISIESLSNTLELESP